MTYYRVKPEHDNTQLYRIGKSGHWERQGFLVGNELYTAKELERYEIMQCRRIKPEMFEQVEISKRKIYWFFGARFAAK